MQVIATILAITKLIKSTHERQSAIFAMLRVYIFFYLIDFGLYL